MCTAVVLSTPQRVCVEASIRQTEEVSEETTCERHQEGGEERSIRGQQGVLVKEEEVGGAEQRKDQEERMSIISATAPQ